VDDKILKFTVFGKPQSKVRMTSRTKYFVAAQKMFKYIDTIRAAFREQIIEPYQKLHGKVWVPWSFFVKASVVLFINDNRNDIDNEYKVIADSLQIKKGGYSWMAAYKNDRQIKSADIKSFYLCDSCPDRPRILFGPKVGTIKKGQRCEKPWLCPYVRAEIEISPNGGHLDMIKEGFSKKKEFTEFEKAILQQEHDQDIVKNERRRMRVEQDVPYEKFVP